MGISLHSAIVGANHSTRSRAIVLMLAVGGFISTFAGYASGLFSTAGGVLLIPFYAAVVGMSAGCWAGYSKSGLLLAWLLAYTPMLGFHAESALLGPTGQSLGEQLAYLVRSDILVVLGTQAIIFGTVAFVIEFLLQEGFNLFRENFASTVAGRSN